MLVALRVSKVLNRLSFPIGFLRILLRAVRCVILVRRESEQPRRDEDVAAVADLGDEPRVGRDLEAVLVLEGPQLSGGRLEQGVELPVAVGALVMSMRWTLFVQKCVT